MRDYYYDVAQVCINGHLITDMAQSHQQDRQDFCAKCGKPTIMACPSCSEPIKGYCHIQGVISAGNDLDLPSYCSKCGKPYPWTEARLTAAADLVREADLLDAPEKEQLIETFGDIVNDSPRTQLAATRANRLMKKAGTTIAGVLRDMFVDIASEAAKKILLP